MPSVLRRPFDVLLIVFFSSAILYGFLFSLPEGLGVPVAPDSPWPPLRALYDWAVEQEPTHLDPPVALLAACWFDGFFQAPMLCFLLWGWVSENPVIRTPVLFYAGAAVTNMFFYFSETLLGPHPPLDLAVYLPFNLPWMLAPIALAWRVRSDPALQPAPA